MFEIREARRYLLLCIVTDSIGIQFLGQSSDMSKDMKYEYHSLGREVED